MNRLKGKTVLITGATSGTCKATSEQLTEYICNSNLMERHKSRLSIFSTNGAS